MTALPFYDAVIFDHDGTLVDSEAIHHASWQHTLATFKPGTELSLHDYFTHYNGLPTLATARLLKTRFGLTASAEALYEHKINGVTEWLTQHPFPLMPFAREILEALAARQIPIGLATGARRAEIDRSLDAHGLRHFFGAIATREDVAEAKPSPLVYQLAAAQLGIAPERCLAVEDSPPGEAAALSAGLFCLRLNGNAAKDRLEPCQDLQAVWHWMATRLRAPSEPACV